MSLLQRCQPLANLFRQNVRQLAHYLYVLRGCREGRAKADWYEAEGELKTRLLEDFGGG